MSNGVNGGFMGKVFDIGLDALDGSESRPGVNFILFYGI